MHSYIAGVCADSSKWIMILLLNTYNWIPILAVTIKNSAIIFIIRIDTLLQVVALGHYLVVGRSYSAEAQVVMLAVTHHYRALPHVPES